MSKRKTLVSLILATVFIALLLCTASAAAIIVSKLREQDAARREYYTSILEQAPCLQSICPGFEGGRESALEILSQSGQVRAIPRGVYYISLDFIDANAEEVDSAVITFAVNEAGELTVVRSVSFGLHQLTLDSVLMVLGEPDKYLFISGCGKGTRVLAELYYVEEGVIVEIEYQTWTPGRQMLEGTTPIYVITYFQPADFQAEIEESLQDRLDEQVVYNFHPSVTRDDLVAQIRPWPELGLSAGLTPTVDFCPR